MFDRDFFDKLTSLKGELIRVCLHAKISDYAFLRRKHPSLEPWIPAGSPLLIIDVFSDTTSIPLDDVRALHHHFCYIDTPEQMKETGQVVMIEHLGERYIIVNLHEEFVEPVQTAATA